MRFKNWLQESLAGPGGGPDSQPTDVTGINQNIAQHGAGAFFKGGDMPPKSNKSPTKIYEDPRFTRKIGKKTVFER